MLSETIRPQDDLWGAVNSDWLAANPIPEDKASWGAFETLREQAEEDVHAIIQDAVHQSTQPEHGVGEEDHESALIAALYQAYMDEAAIEAKGVAPIRERCAPLAAITTVEALVDASAQAYRQGVGSFFSFYIWLDADDPTRYVPHMGQSGIGLPDKAYYVDEEHAAIHEAYIAHMATMYRLVFGDTDPGPHGGSERTSDAGQPMTDDIGDLAQEWAETVFALEAKIAQAHWDRAKCRDALATHNPMTVEELRSAWPLIDRYLDGIGLPEDARGRILVSQPDVVTAIGQCLTQEPLAHWIAWLTWRMIRSTATLGPQALVDEDFAFNGHIMNGAEMIRPRYKRAIGLVEHYLGEPLGKRYVARHYPPQAQAQMDELIQRLLDAYEASITDLPWMQPDTKAKALVKLSKFTPKVGAPTTWRSYEDLAVDGEDLIGAVLACRAFDYAYELDRLNRPVDRTEWLMTPQTVNAYYSPLQNEIVFPAAILQPPFFSPDADPAYNYGGIGAVIGHEIGHGFDDQGSRYDGDGVLANWWTDADREAFEARTKALIDQFQGQIPRALAHEEGLSGVNGELTLGENIGDLGGVGIAYKAWRAYVEAHGCAELVDGFTPDQRFFIGWAHSWRSQYRNERARQLLAIDPHSPAEFRANIVRNVDAFHAAFATQEGDGMWLDPEARVTIW